MSAKRKKKSILALVKSHRKTLKNKGITIDKRGRARRAGKAISAEKVRRALATIARDRKPASRKPAARKRPAVKSTKRATKPTDSSFVKAITKGIAAGIKRKPKLTPSKAKPTTKRRISPLVQAVTKGILSAIKPAKTKTRPSKPKPAKAKAKPHAARPTKKPPAPSLSHRQHPQPSPPISPLIRSLINASDAALWPTENDQWIATTYKNITDRERLEWSRTLDENGQWKITPTAAKIIRKQAIENFLEKISPRELLKIRKSLYFMNDRRIQAFQEYLGPLERRHSISKQDTRDLIDHVLLQTLPDYKEKIEKRNRELRLIYEEMLKFLKSGLDENTTIGEMRKRHPDISERELWSMIKSPGSIGVEIA